MSVRRFVARPSASIWAAEDSVRKRKHICPTRGAERRVCIRTGLTSHAAITVVLFTVNQARLFVVVASMRAWGFRAGYERSHVFLGTILSTLGVVVGLLLFARLVVKQERPKGGPGARWAGVG